ncbi:MAG: 30S ribosomal protein S6 [Candidatus Hydrogenedentes bacterium]|nr:30S ribosomal protein S6 [Candidatus Hydrogenedentota bacterium]
MRTYEALYIASAAVDDDGIQTMAKDTETLVANHGGAIVRSEIWGRRKLAYVVKKQSEGNYILLRFQAKPDFIARLESTFKLNESILRYLIVHLDEPALRLEEEQQRRKREELARSSARAEDDDDDQDAVPVPGRRGHADDDED